MPARDARSMELPIQYRAFKVDRSLINKEKRTVRVLCSTEEPVQRYWGTEILDHAETSIDLGRMRAGAAVLCEHDVKMRCGITESASVSPSGLETEIRFAKTPFGESCMGEVEDGTLRWLSVGYRVFKTLVDEDEEEYRVIGWEPLECSFVAIPADPNARVLGRNQSSEKNQVEIMKRSNIPGNILLERSTDTGGGAPIPTTTAAPVVIPTPAPEAPAIVTARNAEHEELRVREILSLGYHWGQQKPELLEAAKKAVKDGTTIGEFRGKVIAALETGGLSIVPSAGGQQRGTSDASLAIGDRFVRSESYRAESKNGRTARIRFEIPDETQFRTTFNAGTESLTSIAKLPGVPGMLDQQTLYIANIMAQGTTEGLTVRYIQEDAYTNAATAVAEGAAKPEGTLDVSEVDATVRKSAVFLKVTDEMLSDFSQMASYINSRLSYMVQALEDNHLINGTGSSNQIKGVLNFSGIQTISAVSSSTPADAIFKGISYVRGANAAGFVEPDAVVIHPLDWMNLKLQKDGNGQYFGGGPFSGTYGIGGFTNVGLIWGLPAVVTTSIAQGTALVGAFRLASQIFRRRGLMIETTNSDNDDFQKNLVTLRAEQRLALAVYKPKAFCTVTAIPSVP